MSEEKIQEVLEILGEQFSKLQIQEALSQSSLDVDQAVEYLLSNEAELRNQELFPEQILAKSQSSKEAQSNRAEISLKINQGSHQNSNQIQQNKQLNLFQKSYELYQPVMQQQQHENHKTQNIISHQDVFQMIQSVAKYTEEEQRNLHKEMKRAFEIFNYSDSISYEANLRMLRLTKEKSK